MSHVRPPVVRKEDLAADVAPDRISPRVTASAVEEGEPLVGELSVGHTVVPDIGRHSVARENRTFADVADDAETETRRGNVEGRSHHREML